MTQILLNIKNISKFYKINKTEIKKALENINLEINKSEILALLGVNGAGKTTLSSIIATLHPPTSGDILWNEKSIYKDIIEYRRIIGFCPQEQNLDENFNLEESLSFQGRFYGIYGEKLKEKIEYLFGKFKLNVYSKKYVNVLSGGYKQRFMITRALIHSPKLLILDEPTVGLDPKARHDLWDFILKLKNDGISIILTTHYLDEAEKLSDRVCFIDSGKIKIIDTSENLKNNLQKNNLEDVFLQLTKEEL